MNPYIVYFVLFSLMAYCGVASLVELGIMFAIIGLCFGGAR